MCGQRAAPPSPPPNAQSSCGTATTATLFSPRRHLQAEGSRREQLLSRCGDICVASRRSPRLPAGDCESHAPCCTKQHRARSETAPAAVRRDMCPIRACLVLVWSVMRVQGARMDGHTSKPKTRLYEPITSERQLYTVRFDGRKTSQMHETAKISRPSSSLGPV